MKTSERLLNASKMIWDAYNEHPFVLGIQNGTLERDKFRYYIMQDFLYLKDYAKTYAVGVAKAKSVETANLVILIETLDRLSAHYTEEQLRHLEDIFIACSRYEMAFWQMAWEMRL